jgi:hypothetical protein
MRQICWIILIPVLFLAGCRTEPPPPNSMVNVAVPGVRANVNDNGGVFVKHPAGRVIVP